MSARVVIPALVLVATALSSPARAGDADVFAAAVKDATGDYNRPWVISKLTTFKLGKKCWAKLPDRNLGAVHAATFASRDVVDYAKAVTGEDWSAIETQTSDREANKALVEPKMDAFKARFGITVTVDGDDCDAKQSALWLRYWTGAVGAIKNYPPPAGKAFVTIDVSSKTRDLTVDVSKDGTTFTIRAPKDIEAAMWNDKLERPFRKLASGITDDFAFSVKESTGDYHSAWAITKFHVLKVGKKCAAKLPDRELGAVHAATFVTRDLAEWAKGAGADDWDGVEGQSVNDPQTNRDLVAKDMDAFKKRFSFTITVEGDDCDAKQSALWLKYWTSIAGALKNYPPKAKAVKITLAVTAKAKTFGVTVGKDGATFAFTGPRDKEPDVWTGTIEKAFEKVARKP